MTWADALLDARVLGYLLLALVVLFALYREICVYRMWRRRRLVQAEIRRMHTAPPVVNLSHFRDVTARKEALAQRGIEVDELRVIVHVDPSTTNHQSTRKANGHGYYYN